MRKENSYCIMYSRTSRGHPGVVLFVERLLTQDAMIRNPKAPAKCEVYTSRDGDTE